MVAPNSISLDVLTALDPLFLFCLNLEMQISQYQHQVKFMLYGNSTRKLTANSNLAFVVRSEYSGPAHFRGRIDKKAEVALNKSYFKKTWNTIAGFTMDWNPPSQDD